MGTGSSVLNFGAGPAKLPPCVSASKQFKVNRDYTYHIHFKVLADVQEELLSYNGSGVSIMEMSHRSKEYTEINIQAQKYVRELLHVPDNYKIIFMQGGGTGAFAAVAMNLINRTGSADYLVTGTWSSKAAKEAAKYGKVHLVLPKAPLGTIPERSTWQFSANASYVYYCANETVDGVEFPMIPDTNGVPLVTDMSSSIMTRAFDVSKFGVIFGGAQKNIGPAGVTVAIIREDLLGSPMSICPAVFDFTHIVKENSVHNTPATFSVYVMNKVFEWIAKNGGVAEMERQALVKSQLLYAAIEDSNGFYVCPIDKACRSRMNVPFRVGGTNGDEELEKKFLVEAEKVRMQQLKGHRSVGGIRASLYNAVSLEDVTCLVRFMAEFQNAHN